MTYAPLSPALALLSLASFCLTLWRWLLACRFPLHRRVQTPASPPGCSILKPLKGRDAATKSCLRSWLTQDYPGPVQILFGVDSPDDPACAIVRELLAEFPQADARLVLCQERHGVNNKVSTLRQLEPLLNQPLVLISDADVSVPPDFLSNLAPLFLDPKAGLVNCFYRLANPTTPAMQWEAIAINSDFWSSVLQARSLEKVDFALGAVMALPLSQLQAIGGFSPLADVLADDYHLGRLIAERGKRIIFCNVVVDCHEPPRNWRQTWTHQARWARTIRSCQPSLFFLSILENATLWPLLWLGLNLGRWVISRGSPAHLSQIIGICLGFFLFRIATALHQQHLLTQSRGHVSWFWLVPVKDLLNLALWLDAFRSNHVQWRGQPYLILPNGNLQKAD